MNIIDYPGMILTKDDLWKQYCNLNYKDRSVVSSIIRNFYSDYAETETQDRLKFKIVK